MATAPTVKPVLKVTRHSEPFAVEQCLEHLAVRDRPIRLKVLDGYPAILNGKR